MDVGSYFTRMLGPAYYRRYEHAPGVFTQFHEYAKHDDFSSDELQAIQIKKLRALFIHAYKYTRYYRRIFDQAAFNPGTVRCLDDLAVLPVLKQDKVRSGKGELCAWNLGAESYHSTTTGGTRGKKMPFNRDNACRAQRLALQWRSDSWAGWRPYERVAYLWPAIQDIEPPSGWKHTLKDHIVKRTHLFYGGRITEHTARRIYDNLRQFQPAVIRCFTSPAFREAEFMRREGLNIPGLKAVVCTGEPLSQHQRQQIESGFGVPVFDLYASREHGTTAAECHLHKGKHIAIDSVVLEVIRDGRQAESGQPGKIVVTDLLNFAMPLIRYEIGDVGALSPKTCDCGLPYPLLDSVIGRTVDGFYDMQGAFISTISLGSLIDRGPSIGQVQFVQEDLNTVLVRFGAMDSVPETVRKYYTGALKKLLAGLSMVKFELVDQIETEKSGKYRFTVSRLNRSDIS